MTFYFIYFLFFYFLLIDLATRSF